MAITQVGTVQAGNATNGADVTLTFDGSPAEDDLVLLVGGTGDLDAAGDIGPVESGYTQRALFRGPGGSPPFSGGVWTKPLGVTPDSSVTGQGSGNAAEGTAYASVVLRGVDLASPLDITIVETGPTTGADADLDGGTIVTDGAWVFLYVVTSGNIGSFSSSPSGYTTEAVQEGVDTVRAHLILSSKADLAPGAEDPGAYDWQSSTTWYGFFIAIRPETLDEFPTQVIPVRYIGRV